jgi:hypothetical protein
MTPQEVRTRAADRKAARAERAESLWSGKPGLMARSFKAKPKIAGESRKAAIKADCVRLLGQLDRLANGNQCRIHGTHPGEVAYHLLPQGKGDAVRLDPKAVVWACAAANSAEQKNRQLYKKLHRYIFGAERMDYLETVSKQTVHYSTAYLLELRTQLRREVGERVLRNSLLKSIGLGGK